MAQAVAKVCHVCAADLSGRRRTKDPRGRYFCKPCWHSLLAEYYQRKHAPIQPTEHDEALAADAQTAAIAANEPSPEPPDAGRSLRESPRLRLGEVGAARTTLELLSPMGVFVPAALCFADTPVLRLVGAVSLSCLGATLIISLAARLFGARSPTPDLAPLFGEVASDLLNYGGVVLTLVGVTGLLLWVAWLRTGALGMGLMAAGLVLVGARVMARTFCSSAPGNDRAETAPEPAADAGGDVAPPASEAPATSTTWHAPQTAAVPVDARPRCQPVFGARRALLDAQVSDADFRMSDLISAATVEGQHPEADEHAALPEPMPAFGAAQPLRLHVERSAPRHDPQGDDDSSLAGFPAAQVQRFDAARRAWA